MDQARGRAAREGGAKDAKRWTQVGTMQEARSMLKVLFMLLCDAKEQVCVEGLGGACIVDCYWVKSKKTLLSLEVVVVCSNVNVLANYVVFSWWW